jgi:hypothetical protein
MKNSHHWCEKSVRLRIDPVILYSTWKKDYIDLVEKIFIYVKPERITIGEYCPSKGLTSHINSRFPVTASWVAGTNWNKLIFHIVSATKM